MYSNKMALAVRANGRVLREARNGEDTTVFLPFGCDYSLLIKNLNSVRALVKVWIDGTDVTEGTQLIVRANDSVDLERFIKNGNLDAGNKFKFIERTRQISNHRGNKVDDGLIRVEFEFERPAPVITTTYYPGTTYLRGGPFYGSNGGGVSGSLGGATHDSYSTTDASYRAASASSSETSAFLNQVGTARGMSVGQNSDMGIRSKKTSVQREVETDVGITVPGAVSNQQFKIGAWFPTDGVKHVMVMQMLGEVEGQVVQKPVTVEMKPTCSSCGKVNKATSKFCSECGTGLQLV